MRGEDVYLFPNAALHLGLALHELTIDSLARGAMGPAGGEVVLAASQRRNDQNEPELVVTWTEHFARPPEGMDARMSSKSGFSGTVLGRIVPQALSASVWHETSGDRMIYQLAIPSSQYEPNSRH